MNGRRWSAGFSKAVCTQRMRIAPNDLFAHAPLGVLGGDAHNGDLVPVGAILEGGTVALLFGLHWGGIEHGMGVGRVDGSWGKRHAST